MNLHVELHKQKQMVKNFIEPTGENPSNEIIIKLHTEFINGIGIDVLGGDLTVLTKYPLGGSDAKCWK